MKKILFLTLAILFQSCVTNKYLSSSTPIVEISDIGYFEPLAIIELIKKQNKSEPSDSLSIVSKQKIDSLLSTNRKKYKIKERITLNKKIQEKVDYEISFLIQSAMTKRNLEGIKITPVLDSILESRNQRFGLGVLAVGFGRRKGNYGGQIAKGVAVGVLTLGLFVPVPIKSNLRLFSIIVDSQKNEISFYKATLPIEKSPTNYFILKTQLDKLYENYLFKKK